MRDFLWMSVVGSHAWKMETNESDTDVVVIHAAPIDDILLGKLPRSKHKSNLTPSEFKDRYDLPVSSICGVVPPSIDITEWEIGMLVSQLKKSSVNALWVVLSPLFHARDPVHQALKELLEKNPRPRRTWPSVKGMSYNTLRTGKTKKKLRMTMRMINQFLLYADFGDLTFNWDEEEFDIEYQLKYMETIVDSLPPDPNVDDELDALLLLLRKKQLL